MNEFIPGHATTDFSRRPYRCPACGRIADRATSLDPGPERPRPGGISICIGCGALALYAGNLKLRKPTDRELIEIQRSARWPRIEQAVRAVREGDIFKATQRT